MSKLKALKAGLSKSYQSLNNLGNDPEETPFREPKSRRKHKPGRFLKNAMARVAPKSNFRASQFSIHKGHKDWTIPENEVKNITSRRPHSMSVASVPPEQASLLGNLSDCGDDIELRHIQLSVVNARTLGDDGSAGEKQTVNTRHGTVTIAVAGDTTKPPIVTFHDLGLNHITNFQAFMLYPEMRELLNSFCLVHINAPGQEEGAPALPEGYVYPTMEELAEIVYTVKEHLQLKTFIGFGVGLGANVLARYAVKFPNDMDALLLINCSSTTAGWIEWGYQKLNIRHMKSGEMSSGMVDYLLWHHFGKIEACNQDLVTVYKQHFEKGLNATNLMLLVDSYIRRTDLGIVREMDPNKKKEVRMIRCQVLNMTSFFSPHKDDTVTFNARLDPSISTWMKIQDCGLVLDEQPSKVVEAFKLFLQGVGYVVGTSRRASSVTHAAEAFNKRKPIQASLWTRPSAPSDDIHITENPMLNPSV